MSRIPKRVGPRHHLGPALFLMLCCTAAAGQPPAFPGAEGYGALASGGRGGRMLAVTNLENDLTAGSLPRAIRDHNEGIGCPGSEPDCPTTIVFEISGTILLKSRLLVTAPNLTIAGQTAPGDGIALRGDPEEELKGYLLDIRSSDVIVRYLRIRPGAGSENLDQNGYSGDDLGGIAITTEGVERVILDHVSVSWAEDKALNIFQGPEYITVQDSILAETLGCANHSKSVKDATQPMVSPCSDVYCCEALMDQGRVGEPHSRLITISSFPEIPGTPEQEAVSPRNISFHRNLLANTNKRFPNVTAQTHVKFVNNVVHNFGANGAKVHAGKDPLTHFAELDYVGNYVRPGPWTVEYQELEDEARYVITARAPQPSTLHQIYEDENFLDTRRGVAAIRDPSVEGNLVEWLDTWVIGDPEPIPVPVLPAIPDAYDGVLAFSGTFPRDSADHRIVTETDCRSGTIVDHPDEVGGWPVLAPESRPADWDEDGDGMEDDWETANGLDPMDSQDGNDIDPNRSLEGYTNLELYLADRAAEILVGQMPGDCSDVDPPTVPVWEAAEVLSSTEIFLDWYDSKDRVEVVGYDVERRLFGGFPIWQVVETGQPNSESSANDDLAPDTLYEFRITALDPSGNSSEATISALTLMTPVENLSAEANGTPGGTWEDWEVVVSWDAHPKATSYEIWRNGVLLEASYPRTSYTEIVDCVPYTYTVIAIDETPGSENRSEAASASTAGGTSRAQCP